ncbi:MAG: ribose-phosphate diphosphokinase [Cyclobacteriaceae bacterium]|nr:ribose-phosphate diphosphokinase [Cyclobacteriaceae bacterium]
MSIPMILHPGNENLGLSLKRSIPCQILETKIRKFPDGESYVRFLEPVTPGPLVILASLNQPDTKLLPLIFAANRARDMGAKPLILVAPYLAYLRQDQEFNKGEVVTNREFATLISNYFDHLITVDPHLHRIDSLNQIYSISTDCLQSAPLIAQWILKHVTKPVVIGPDSESKQWVQEIAHMADAPYEVFSKQRLSDKEVQLKLPDMTPYQDHVPVLADDIISTAGTMIEAVNGLKKLLPLAAVCVGIHGIFANNSHLKLQANGIRELITTNTISHSTNQIDVAPLITSAVQEYLVRIGVKVSK